MTTAADFLTQTTSAFRFMIRSTLKDRPLRTMFLLTSMPVGGAETLLVNLVRRLDPDRIKPMIGCMKDRGTLGIEISKDVPVFDNLLRHKYDMPVVGRLKQLFYNHKIDAVVTVGAGDKMFWGRIAAKRARVPVVLSALHSTGWPDGVGKLNRMLTPITDGFIAVARQHAEYQVHQEKFPAEKVFVIPNGIDADRFVFNAEKRMSWRTRLGIDPSAPVTGIVAALRPEKNHALFLAAAQNVLNQIPQAQFVIAGDGPERSRLEAIAQNRGLTDSVHFLGSVKDVVGVLSAIDLFALTSKNEASPVSILEACSCERPVVAPDVGSISEAIKNGENGWLVPEGNLERTTECWLDVLSHPARSGELGVAGRHHVLTNYSLDAMTEGYMSLIENCFLKKHKLLPSGPPTANPGFFQLSSH